MSEEKRLTVDPGKCIGCGLCVSACPGVFALGDDGKSYVKDNNACESCDCEQVMKDCPAEAITWAE